VKANKYQSSLQRREIMAEQIEADLNDGVRVGYGAISVKTGGKLACATVAENQKGQKALINKLRPEVERVTGGPLGELVYSSVDIAFKSTQRKKCALLYGSAADLQKLLTGVKRLRVSYKVLPVWFSPKHLKIAAEEEERMVTTKVVSEEQRRHAIEREKKLAAERRKALNLDKKEKQQRLRQTNGSRVVALTEAFKSSFNEVINSAVVPKTSRGELPQNMIPRLYPELISWANQRGDENWEVNVVKINIRDYGQANWRGRLIEATSFTANVQLKNRSLGEYKNTCFTMGRLIDEEFQVSRAPVIAGCSDVQAISNWEAGNKFKSLWTVR
jgi:hypothetical protein